MNFFWLLGGVYAFLILFAILWMAYLRPREYWKLYWRVGTSIVLAGFFLASLAVWIFLAWPHYEVFEPIVILFGSAIALLVSQHFVGRSDRLRSDVSSVSLEEQEDHSTDPWRPINHSFWRIEWSAVVQPDLAQAVKEFWIQRSFFPPISRALFLISANILESLKEETHTLNFRLLRIFGSPQFIRVYKEIDIAQLECRQTVAKHLTKKSVFESKYLKYVTPKPQKYRYNNDSRRISDPAFENLHVKLLKKPLPGHIESAGKVFEYASAPDLKHFGEKPDDEIGHFAECFAAVQNSLQDIGGDELETIKNHQDISPIVRQRIAHNELRDDWEAIVREVDNSQASPAAKTLASEKYLISRWVEEIEQSRKYTKEKTKILLHDVHPHNVFYEGEACVLIYDYSWVGPWNHEIVVAFTLHRFVREIAVRKRNFLDLEDAKEIVAAGSNKFLENYQKTCSVDLTLKEDFRNNLAHYIRDANMDKLISISRSCTGLKRDSTLRSPARLYGELRKFLRFMKEADEFRP